MKSLITLLAVVAMLFTVPSVSLAGGKNKGARGKVTAVDSGSITINNKKKGESKTYKINDNTTVSVDGETGKHAADLKAGMKASITTGSGADVAGSITATSKGKGKKAKKTS